MQSFHFHVAQKHPGYESEKGYKLLLDSKLFWDVLIPSFQTTSYHSLEIFQITRALS